MFMKAKITSWIEKLGQRKKKDLFLTIALITFSVFSVIAQQSISGTVVSQEGPIAGASIAVKGTSKGTSADANGQFKISNVSSQSVLVISSIGFTSKEVAVGNQTSLKITLENDPKSLNEVVVIGYGSEKEGFDRVCGFHFIC
jgi:hypothetical protein